ncbi:protein C3orf33 homolog isoform X2 [Stegostoma tigrinum]|uniref:protein C3orf33 homolog isoform X2 n=1 Tax=Stegostoma tigrinum TaxID=3053191 RepID=UPI00202B4D31|nr:protein C3orf33 homolog isoform X2 [Stegostoma tigrinum]
MPDRDRNVLGSYLSRLVEIADEHLNVVRFTKFNNALEIPDSFIEKRVKLRGRVHHVTKYGLEVEHVPITLPIVSILQRRQSSGRLMVRLAGLQMTDEGKAWLKEQIKPSHIVWFQPLRRENSFIDSIVRLNKTRFFSVSLNEEILRRGLGRVINIEGLQSNPKLYWRLQSKLLKAELKALKKGKGIWKEATLLETISDNLQKLKIFLNLNNLKSWVNSFRKK